MPHRILPEVFPTLETPRFHLREISPSDAQSIFEYFSDEEVTKYYDPHFTTLTHIDEAYSLLKIVEEGFKTDERIRWGICSKESGELVGTVGFHDWSREFRRAEIGYELSRENWGKGVMTEVLPSVISFGFSHMNLNRIEATCHAMNEASCKVLERAQFRLEGTMRDYWYVNGSFQNVRMYSFLKQDLLV